MRNMAGMKVEEVASDELLDLMVRQGGEILEIREDDSIGLSVVAISNTLLVRKVR